MASADVITDEFLPTNASATPLPAAAPVFARDESSITLAIGTTLADAEYQLIMATLQHFNNHKERTAAVLGVSLKTLYNRLKEYAGAADPGTGEAAAQSTPEAVDFASPEASAGPLHLSPPPARPKAPAVGKSLKGGR